MKTLTIGTKRQADRLLVESLFKPVEGHTLNFRPLDGKEYRIDPSNPFIGRQIAVNEDVFAVYPERVKGRMIRLMCVCK